MSTYTEQQLAFATGMVERRAGTVQQLEKCMSKDQAVATHRSVCGAVKEVRKHHRNILERVDNVSAGHAIKCGELLETVEGWLGLSRGNLAGWGSTPSEVRSIEDGVGL